MVQPVTFLHRCFDRRDEGPDGVNLIAEPLTEHGVHPLVQGTLPGTKISHHLQAPNLDGLKPHLQQLLLPPQRRVQPRDRSVALGLLRLRPLLGLLGGGGG